MLRRHIAVNFFVFVVLIACGIWASILILAIKGKMHDVIPRVLKLLHSLSTHWAIFLPTLETESTYGVTASQYVLISYVRIYFGFKLICKQFKTYWTVRQFFAEFPFNIFRIIIFFGYCFICSYY
jgi:hypothetical protein